MTSVRVENVPITTLAAFLEACAAHPSAQIEDIAAFAGFSVGTAKRALPSLRTLGLVKRTDDGVWKAANPEAQRGMDDEVARLMIRRALQGFRPFEALCEGLSLGEDVATASRKASLALGLDAPSTARLAVLIRWGTDLGIVVEEQNGIRLAPDVQPNSSPGGPVLSAADLASEAQARLYNARQLGRDANNYLDETDRQLLADALLQHDRNPRHSIEQTGQALEDFLREVAVHKGLASEAGRLNGIGQLANLLHSKGVIHNHHQKLADAVSTGRNAAAHRKDKKTMAPWTITATVSFGLHCTSLAVMRAIHEYMTTGSQVL